MRYRQLTLGSILPEETKKQMLKIATHNATRMACKAKLSARATIAKRDSKGRFLKSQIV